MDLYLTTMMKFKSIILCNEPSQLMYGYGMDNARLELLHSGNISCLNMDRGAIEAALGTHYGTTFDPAVFFNLLETCTYVVEDNTLYIRSERSGENYFKAALAAHAAQLRF